MKEIRRFEPLLRCPFCHFMNEKEEVITYHIKNTRDTKHNVDLSKIDKSRYIAADPPATPYGPYTAKENLDLPSLQCPFCDYQDKIGFDLSLHMFEWATAEISPNGLSPEEFVRRKEIARQHRVGRFG